MPTAPGAHATEVHATEVHASEVHATEVHASEVHATEVHWPNLTRATSTRRLVRWGRVVKRGVGRVPGS